MCIPTFTLPFDVNKFYLTYLCDIVGHLGLRVNTQLTIYSCDP